jgi:hypothetical protein
MSLPSVVGSLPVAGRQTSAVSATKHTARQRVTWYGPYRSGSERDVVEIEKRAREFGV